MKTQFDMQGCWSTDFYIKTLIFKYTRLKGGNTLRSVLCSTEFYYKLLNNILIGYPHCSTKGSQIKSRKTTNIYFHCGKL